MKYSENALNILSLLSLKGIKREWVNRRIKGTESIDDILCILRNSDKTKPEWSENFLVGREKIEEQLSAQKNIDGVVAVGEPGFPIIPSIVKPSERPVVLFYKGDIKLLSDIHHNVAVIGLLNPSSDIEEREKKFVSKLVEQGYNIVSGLALGCDTISHKSALQGKGKTIAILPSSLDSISPASNKQLAEHVVFQDGLLVSEYFRQPKSKYEMVGRYIERDRLQPMFCKAICLAASYDVNDQGNDSGSRHAMQKAKEYGVKRYVMYDNLRDGDNPQFDLSRKLLRDSDVKILSGKTLSEIISNQLIEHNLFS